MYRRIAALASALFMLATLFAANPARAAHTTVLECGAIVTTSIVLGADIGPCGDDLSGETGHGVNGHGLVVRGSNITIDLNGYTIFGHGGIEMVAHQAAGIKVDQQDNVTIFSSQPGGTIRDFFHGVWILGGSGNQVGGLNILDNNDGPPAGGGNGIVLQNAVNSKVIDNIVDRSGGFGGISIFNDRRVPPCCPQGAANNLIRGNTVTNANNRAGTVGLSIEAGSGHVIEDNTVAGSASDGIRLSTTVSSTRVRNNEVRTSGRDGIHLQENLVTGASADRNLVQGNQSGRNTRDGIHVEGEHNRILGNTALQNGNIDLVDTNVACDMNTWSGNIFGTADPACAGS
ncbi:MAG TPA: right-handed parallel beta-helix repeat-containing protein [Acidimicrobiales bacterium]|nr:right-handed parallel beta-helix repeat-containing protein [Acidimicrobiales bacterium]